MEAFLLTDSLSCHLGDSNQPLAPSLPLARMINVVVNQTWWSAVDLLHIGHDYMLRAVQKNGWIGHRSGLGGSTFLVRDRDDFHTPSFTIATMGVRFGQACFSGIMALLSGDIRPRCPRPVLEGLRPRAWKTHTL